MTSPRPSFWLRIILTAISLLGLILAIALASQQINWQVIRQVSGWVLATMALLVIANQLLAATLFWVVTRSFDARPPVGWVKMLDLLCASAVLNYLPLRAGLLGRAAYLKAYHQLPWRQSVQSLAVVLGVSLAVSLGALGVVVMASGTGVRWLAGIAGLMILMAISGPLVRLMMRRPTVGAWSWGLIKGLDLLVTAGRLWLAFKVVGYPIGWDVAMACGGAGMVVSMIGLTPNGLGLREWAVGMSAMGLMPSLGAMGLAAAVLDRAVEAVVLGPWGGWAMLRLSRQSIHLDRLRVM